jgi:general stress protein YciG
MDPEEQREIARMGGRASHGGRGRDYEEDEDRDSRGRWTSRSESRSGSRYESRSSGRGYDEDDWRSRGRSSRDYDEDRGNGHSRRGFAGMDPEEQREISRMGGRASHGGRGRDYEEDDWRSRGRSSRDYDEDRGNGHSRRGFAAMDPEEQREISRMGGRASHGSRGRDYEEDRDNRSGRSSSWDDQPRDEYGRFTSERR